MKVAIVHDWLVTYAGAERVLQEMLHCFPDADLFSVVDFLAPGQRDFIANKRVTTSFIQKLPYAKTRYRHYLPLMPLAVEQFNLSRYDLVISSSHAVAKGVLTGPDQLHICMCYSPIRYAWDLQHQYLKESGLEKGVKGWVAKWLLHKVRLWDARTANGVDEFVAISNFIARRIWKTYRRDSVVVYPPVSIEQFPLQTIKQDFYVTASRMVPYKKMDLIVEAFSASPERKLVVIGDGPDYKKIRAKAAANVEMLGFQSGDILQRYLRDARAFVFAAEEDFGIAPLEAQACGTPVIAFGRGGALETIVGLDEAAGAGTITAESVNATGLFFKEQTVPSLLDAVVRFEENEGAFSAQACRKNAERFAVESFRHEFTGVVSRALAARTAGQTILKTPPP
ncbi:MAG TPA: glycosyl transferase family 1 [Pusillimonas sp.]|nr:glycosyl transferase family 1 [Pusillimonas sp.]